MTRRIVAVAITIVASGACENLKSLPTSPSELTTGITIYEHADYRGRSAHVTSDIKDLKDFEGPCFLRSNEYSPDEFAWDDCVSSIRVAPGWRATLFRDDDFDGDRLEVTADIPNLQLVTGRCDKGGFNDCVTSIRVFRP